MGYIDKEITLPYEEQKHKMQAESWEKSSVYSVNAETGKFRIIHLRPGLKYDYKAQGDWDELVKKYANNVVREDFRDIFLQKMTVKEIIRQFEELGPIVALEYLRNERSQSGWCRMEAVINEKNSEGKVLAFLITIRDITKKVETEITNLKRKKYHEILEKGFSAVHSSEAVIDTETELCRLIKVGGFLENAGFPTEVSLRELIGAFRKMISVDKDDLAIYEKRIDSFYRRVREKNFKRNEIYELDVCIDDAGNERWFRVSAAAVKQKDDSDELYILVFSTDITKSEQIRSDLRKELEESNKKLFKSENDLRREMAMLRSFRNIYVQSLYIDVVSGEVTPISMPSQIASVLEASPREINISNMKLIGGFLKPAFQKPFAEFIRMDDLDERFENVNVLNIQCEGVNEHWYRGNLIPVDRDENGKIAHVIYAIQDVTEEVEKEQTYLKQVKSLTNIYDGCAFHDLDTGKFTVITGSGEGIIDEREPNLDDLLADKPGELKTKHVVMDTKTLNMIMADRDSISREYLGDNGRWKLEEIIAVERHKDGSLRSIMMTHRDISSQKQSELTQNAMSTAIGKTYIALYHYDLVKWEGYEVKADPTIANYMPETIGIDEAVEAFETYDLDTETVLANRDFWDFRTVSERLRDKDIISREVFTKSNGWVQLNIVAYRRDAKGDVTDILWMTREIDEEKKRQLQQQEKLRKANHAAMEATRAKTRFLSNMSHDIRTPMNAVAGFANIAVTHQDDKERVHDCLNKILASSNHLLRLINDILDMSHIESGKMTVHETECVISDIVSSIIPVVTPQIAAKRQRFTAETKDVVHEYVFADALKISRVLINILGNAVKYTKSDGEIYFGVEEYTASKEGFVGFRFTIKDTGQGMSEDFLKRVFVPFERESTTTISGIEGSGLGLAISKNLIEMMGGHLEVESKIGVGTKFTISAELRANNDIDPLEGTEKLHGLKALVIDEDPQSVSSITHSLKLLGLAADSAASASKAQELCMAACREEDPYKVYIINDSLSGESSLDFVRKINENTKCRAAVVMTSYDHNSIADEALRAGVTAFCDKPVFLSGIKTALSGISNEEESGKDESDISELIRSKTLLVVEDNELNREIAVAVLGEIGFTVETANEGSEAVDILNSSEPGHFDLVLMDIQMPVMDGYDATRAIRASDRDDISRIPVVAMSANAFEEDKRLSAQSGMNDHISKPLDVPVMLETILKYLK